MKLFRLFTTFFLSIFVCAAAFAGATTTGHYKATFEGNNVYDVTIAQNQLTWKGLSGEDKGKVRTVDYKQTNLTDAVEVLQWKNKSGSYVTLVLDHDHSKAVCSGQASKTKGSWLWSGTLERLPA